MISVPPARGDLWDTDFDPIKGREQAGRRPALVMSVDTFNRGPAELVVAIPLTRTERKVRWHVSVAPPEGGLSDVSYIKCDGRAFSLERPINPNTVHLGRASTLVTRKLRRGPCRTNVHTGSVLFGTS